MVAVKIWATPATGVLTELTIVTVNALELFGTFELALLEVWFQAELPSFCPQANRRADVMRAATKLKCLISIPQK